MKRGKNYYITDLDQRSALSFQEVLRKAQSITFPKCFLHKLGTLLITQLHIKIGICFLLLKSMWMAQPHPVTNVSFTLLQEKQRDCLAVSPMLLPGRLTWMKA